MKDFRITSKYSAFNARFLSPSEIAESFIPTPQFKVLLKTSHAILMGPRGCGKTTLLKMLTSDALSVWRQKLIESNDSSNYTSPDFIALYIPSDTRWLQEIKSTSTTYGSDSEKLQRLLVVLSILKQWAIQFEKIVANDLAAHTNLAESFIDCWGLVDAAPRFIDIKNSIESMAADIRGYINVGNTEAIFERYKLRFFSSLIDVCTICADLYDAQFGAVQVKWAICFDELEISPRWMRTELIASLRSVDHRILLKLTWSPLMPEATDGGPEVMQDVDIIRLWYSHISDAKSFCKNLADSVVRNLTDGKVISAQDMLGRSIFAEESDSELDYERGTDFYNAMIEVAKFDTSLKQLLISHKIDPDDPFTPSQQLRNTFFRKLKPIVLLRDYFNSKFGRRSRKQLLLYCGLDMVFAMSEGNPRRLIKILSDIVDFGLKESRKDVEDFFTVKYHEQASTLSSLSNQFLDYIKAIPSNLYAPSDISLFDFVQVVGKYFSSRLIDGPITLDPVGSFVVGKEAAERFKNIIQIGLSSGAIIYVGSSPHEVARTIVGSKFRLTFLLSPALKLAVRNYKEVSLDTCFKTASHVDQIALFDDFIDGSEEGIEK